METYSDPSELRKALCGGQSVQKTVFVPTMGALHAGHQALLLRAREISGPDGRVVASIFVNPIQFDQAGDLASYPRTLEQDLALCEQSGVDAVFVPTADVMYAPDRSISVDETSLSKRLCGATRPGHFSGVCTVVLKLFHIVSPTDAVFGEKDFQQLAIIRRMVRDLDIPVTIHGVETVREPDGLAMSSRNRRLTDRDRANAPLLWKGLQEARDAYRAGVPVDGVVDRLRQMIEACENTRIDYIEMVDAETLSPVPETGTGGQAVLALAVFFGDVRLIDHIEL